MSRLPILCVGALTLDTIFALETLPSGAGKFIPVLSVEIAGGMAASQSATVARLGGQVALWASVGDDVRGRQMIADITEEGVDCSAVRRVPGARSAFSTILVDAAGERMVVPHYDKALLSEPESVPDMSGFAAVMTDVRWPNAAELALKAARRGGIAGILDADVTAPETLERLAPLASHIVASEPGATLLTGIDDPRLATERLAQRFSGFVSVTAGGTGVFWFDRATGQVEHCPAPKVVVRDTLAAGDVFHGAFALALSEGRAMDWIMRFACTAAAIKCSRFGGRAGAPTRAESEGLMADEFAPG